jgi:M3 family oligoendopeptidase
MAKKLGYNDYIGLGYKRMKRVDYNQQDVEQFRAEVREHLVPLAVELRRKQAAALGVDKLIFWDDAVHDAAGNPAPHGEHDWMVERATQMFDTMGSDLGGFFRLMVQGKLTDLKNRDGKAGGGFCTAFPSYGLPFIFANFNGTKHDVEVFTHEMGHAYQAYQSRHQPLLDYLWPTYESCEIHSMGLEFLTWPHMEQFFEGDAERFRRIHLTQGLLFIPYGVAVDHFQHLVYAQPDATPAERHAMWQEMERTYLPWRDYGDLPHVATGGFWQFQRHIYLSPFYYIDYTLAQTCALQLWVRSRKDPQGTLASYNALCSRGGEAPFQELARSAGLVSPFQSGCLRDVAAEAKATLA